MAEASTHYKQMENLMGTKIFVLGIKNGKFKCINHATHRIDDSANQKPYESGPR